MPLPDFEDIIHAKILTISAVTAIVGSGASAKVAAFSAIPGWTRPYVTFTEASVVNPQVATDTTLVNSVWRISAWDNSPNGAQVLADALYDGLHDQILTVTGWTNHWFRHERMQRLEVNEEGAQYWHYVGDYRLRADSD